MLYIFAREKFTNEIIKSWEYKIVDYANIPVILYWIEKGLIFDGEYLDYWIED